MFTKSTRFKQVCQLLLSLIVDMKFESNKEYMEDPSLHSSHLKKFRHPRRRKLN